MDKIINYKFNKIFMLLLLNGSSILLISFGVFLAFNINNVNYRIDVYNNLFSITPDSLDNVTVIDSMLNGITVKDYIVVSINDNVEFRINSKDIGIKLNKEETIKKIKTEVDRSLKGRIVNYFDRKNINIIPVFKLNKDTLNEKTNAIKRIINKEKSNAYILLEGDKVIKKPEVVGKKLKESKLTEEIIYNFQNQEIDKVEIKSGINGNVLEFQPEITLKNLKSVNKIIAECSYYINPLYFDFNKVKDISNALDNVYLERFDKDKTTDEFSFNNILMEKDINLRDYDMEDDFVASVLNSAILVAGFDNVSVRTPNSNVQGYIKPGLDINVSKGQDFKFVNPKESMVIIKSEIENNRLYIYIIGDKKDKISYNIVTKSFGIEDIPSRYIEVDSLDNGKAKVVNKGTEGMQVNVYRVLLNQGSYFGKEFLYKNKYSPKERIIYIGKENNKGTK